MLNSTTQREYMLLLTQPVCNSQPEGLELYRTLGIYQHQRQRPTSTKTNGREGKPLLTKRTPIPCHGGWLR